MLPHCRSSYSIIYLLFAWLLGLCYGFVLLSSAAGQNGDLKLFELGKSYTYNLYSAILLREKSENSKDVGYYVTGDVSVDVLWQNDERKLLKLSTKNLQLNIKSKDATSTDGFVPHWSKLENVDNKPALLMWNKGVIEEVSLPKGESTSISNLKRGIASLFQFQPRDESTELDASGKCLVKYTSPTPSTFVKVKTNCVSEDLSYISNPDEFLRVENESIRRTEYELDSSSSDDYFKHITSEERHMSYLSMKKDVGNQVSANQRLIFKKIDQVEIVEGETVEIAVQKIGKAEKVTYTRENLLTELENTLADDKVTFTKLTNSLRDYLKIEHSGKLKPAKAFLKLVKNARTATKEDISKCLSHAKNKAILPQLLDVLGNVQTISAHQAVMKIVHYEEEQHIELSERYLWSLSFSSQPNVEIIEDLLKKYTKLVDIPQKVKETLIMTIASMTNKLRDLNAGKLNTKLIKEVEDTILKHLEYNTGEQRLAYFRALRNLQSPSTIPILMSYISRGSQKEGVLSWKALRCFKPSHWNNEILNLAKKAFFQLDKKYDSSSRTLALDILLESKPNDELLRQILDFLLAKDPAHEVKQYTIQRIKMIAEKCANFRKRVKDIVYSNRRLNNYSTLAPGGLSLALSRRFMSGDSSNGSLVTVQEMKAGIVKRGAVNVVLERDGAFKEVFSLGIFSGGLQSFMSDSKDDEADSGIDETPTAGMELTVLDTQVRPFVFFNGSGELTGHVWSGTASEMTPAFQVILMMQDHSESIGLGSGFIVNVDIKGSTSLDLSGKISISLWNRNAESLVRKSAGMVTIGTMTVNTMFVKSQVEFSAAIEAELNLQSDIDFSSNVHACMRLTQPQSVYRHNIFKIEKIPGSKHNLRISKYKKYNVDGTTYSINRKNNQMCSAIFSE